MPLRKLNFIVNHHYPVCPVMISINLNTQYGAMRIDFLLFLVADNGIQQ